MTPGERRYSLIPSFLDGVAGRLFSLYYSPDCTDRRHCIVCFPPFAEELNKSRRMMTLQAQRFAQLGYSVLIVDFYGTGDSEGDFSDARLEIWREDVHIIKNWLEKQGVEKITLWGLRLGALLAMDSIPQFADRLSRLLLWSPVIKAEQAMTQFLRLRLAADMVQGAENKETTKSMRELLSRGQILEVAGYELHPDLVNALDTLDLQSYSIPKDHRVSWFELVSNRERPPALPIQKIRSSWQQDGIPLEFYSLVGPGFWNTPEITEVPDLINATTQSVAGQESGIHNVA